MTKKLLLIGGGGHCLSCIDVIRLTGQYEIVGVLDRREKVGQTIGGEMIVGSDEEIRHWLDQADQVLITLGAIGRSAGRQALYDMVIKNGGELARVISPRAYVSATADIGAGTIVMHDALVNADAQIGKNCIINTKSLIEHGANVGSHCHVSTRSTLNGDAKIGDNVFVGSHAVVFQGCSVGHNSVVGSGEVIRGNVPRDYAGDPPIQGISL